MTAENTVATLKNTLHTENKPRLTGFGSRDEFVEKVVRPSGYPFFEWNGRVYQLDVGGLPFKDTGILYEDLAAGTKTDVLAYTATLSGWDAVNELISEIRAQAQRKFGNDFSDPAYDI